jgi:4,4'-diaponeurosporenoate glycosyltransferase
VTGALATVIALRSPSLPSAAVYGAYALQITFLLRRLGAFRWWTSAAYPVALVAFVGFFAASVLTRGRVEWRGRVVSRG